MQIPSDTDSHLGQKRSVGTQVRENERDHDKGGTVGRNTPGIEDHDHVRARTRGGKQVRRPARKKGSRSPLLNGPTVQRTQGGATLGAARHHLASVQFHHPRSLVT